MLYTLISIVAAAFYLFAGIHLWLQLSKGEAPTGVNRRFLILSTVAVAGHAVLLSNTVLTSSGWDLSFYHSASLTTWLVAAILIVTTCFKRVETLGVGIMPIAALTVIAEAIFGRNSIGQTTASPWIDLHIFLSIIAYSFLSIAAFQAVLLAIQERKLHNHHPGGIIRILPPLQSMENLLFQLITIGFLIQSAALLSGLFFVEDIFAQHMAHKTVLSAFAWSIFGILLWGRWQYGWRGRTAIRWTLLGFGSLLLGYLGSKLVMDVVLQS